MSAIYQYRIKCETDSKYEYVWSETTPTKCPENTAHTIGDIVIVDTQASTVRTIKEETVETGGNFQTTSIEIDAKANQTTNYDVIYPFNISALSVEFTTEEAHRGDMIQMAVAPDTSIGAITSNLSIASAWVSGNYVEGNVVVDGSYVYTCIQNTVSNEATSDTNYWTMGYRIPVSQTVIDNCMVGYFIKLYDGTNTNDMQRIIEKDTVNNYIYVENNVSNTFSAATPTYVLQTIYILWDYRLSDPWEHKIGESKIGGSHVPKNKLLRITYENKHATQDKTFTGRVEYLY